MSESNLLSKICKIEEWQNVPSRLVNLIKSAEGTFTILKEIIPTLPDIKSDIFYAPEKEKLIIGTRPYSDKEKVAECKKLFEQIPGIQSIQINYFAQVPEDDLYIHIKSADPVMNRDVFGPISSLWQMKPNSFNRVFGGPNPLLATLAGSILTGGTGYLAGTLAEKLLPKKYFEKGKLRRALTIGGGLLGALPGAYWGFDNIREKGLSGVTDSYPWPKEASDNINELFVKYADEAGAAFATRIPVDQFGRAIWNDLSSYGGYTPPHIAAATTGLLSAASIANGGVNLISPFDIARIGIGAGSGYLSGMIVGKTLGALAGLRPEAQNTLQRTGIWAGVLANTIPSIF